MPFIPKTIVEKRVVLLEDVTTHEGTFTEGTEMVKTYPEDISDSIRLNGGIPSRPTLTDPVSGKVIFEALASTYRDLE